MKVTWTLLLLLAGCGVAYVSCAGECNTTHVAHCYETLVHYEGLGFPLYGRDEAELDETCEMMSESFDCIEAYWQQCGGKEVCDDKECSEMLDDIETFSLNTGLRNVEKELCNPGATREAYLENFSCLEGNVESYAACHNDSQRSQDYMTSLTEPSQAIAARCCFFTWYHDCFTNITRDACNENATFFVSFVLHNLITHISQQVCGNSPDVCDKPPLPPTLQGDDVIPLDDGHKDITDVDNNLDGNDKSYATSPVSSIWTLCMTLMYVFISAFLM